MAVNLSPIGNGFQFFSTLGVPLSGGFIYTYQAATTTPLATYTTSAGTIANTNPIVLQTDGRPPQEIWFNSGSNYKLVLTDSANAVIATYDNLYGILGSSSATTAVPVGCILMWSGSIGSIPAGYVICDGTNGTPNLRDRFIVGAGTSYSVGNNGGFASSGVVTSVGTNNPLYYALAFIQKT